MVQKKGLGLKELNKSEYELICEECMLNDFERKILKMKIQDKSIVEMSLSENVSESKISRTIRHIKKKIAKIM